jgi:hypothetical protein
MKTHFSTIEKVLQMVTKYLSETSDENLRKKEENSSLLFKIGFDNRQKA